MFMPLIAALAAFFGSASGKMIIGFFPPSSKLTRFNPDAASRAIARPVGTEPTKPIRSTSGWRTSAEPVAPSPVVMLTTPGGKMPSHNSPMRRLDNGACSEPLIGTRDHSRNAAFAAPTARSTSTSEAKGTSPSFSMLEGLIEAKLLPEAGATHSPPIKRPRGVKLSGGASMLSSGHDRGTQHAALGCLLEGGVEILQGEFRIDDISDRNSIADRHDEIHRLNEMPA